MRLGDRGSIYAPRGARFSWLGLGRRSGAIDVDLYLERADGQRDSLLHIIVVMRSGQPDRNLDVAWRTGCNQVYCDLRAYLMGQNGVAPDVSR